MAECCKVCGFKFTPMGDDIDPLIREAFEEVDICSECCCKSLEMLGDIEVSIKNGLEGYLKGHCRREAIELFSKDYPMLDGVLKWMGLVKK